MSPEPLPPIVEPMLLTDLTPDEARASNAALPLAATRIAPAEPFLYSGSVADRENAATCLAAAELYEAGDDMAGERAVAQVVLNRLRHPAFPKTICGVVFQGAERKTGCQFTFACDGSLARAPDPEAWLRARKLADRAFSGSVFKQVGTATHYHTDWVVPYWRDSLDKVAKVHTQIFYRWRGWWGTPAAFTRHHENGELADARLAPLLDLALLTTTVSTPSAATVIGTSRVTAVVPVLPELVPGQLKGNVLKLFDPENSKYYLQLDATAYPGSYAIVALGLCRDKPVCLVVGWLHADRIPSNLPVRLGQLHSASFMFRKNTQAGVQQVSWNCLQVVRSDPTQCIPGTEPAIAASLADPTVARLAQPE